MIRRGAYLACGAGLGVAGTLWVRRRMTRLVERAKSDGVSREAMELLGRGWQRVERRATDALDEGRSQARRRRQQLHHGLEQKGAPDSSR